MIFQLPGVSIFFFLKTIVLANGSTSVGEFNLVLVMALSNEKRVSLAVEVEVQVAVSAKSSLESHAWVVPSLKLGAVLVMTVVVLQTKLAFHSTSSLVKDMLSDFLSIIFLGKRVDYKIYTR